MAMTAGRQWVVWGAAIGVVALTTSAGVWQMGRAEYKRAAEEALRRQGQLPAWTNADWPCRLGDAARGGTDAGRHIISSSSSPIASDTAPPVAGALPIQRPAALRGHWLQGRTVFLDNRPMGQGSGFVVVTPLRLSAGPPGCPQGVVLVERGWVPRDVQDRLRLPAVETPEGEVQVPGRVIGGLSQVYQLGPEAPPGQASAPVVRQNADPAFWSAWLGQPTLPGAVLQTRPALPGDAPVLRREWPEPGHGQDKHLAYAAQWFAMAAVAAGLTIWFQLIRPRRRPPVS